MYGYIYSNKKTIFICSRVAPLDRPDTRLWKFALPDCASWADIELPPVALVGVVDSDTIFWTAARCPDVCVRVHVLVFDMFHCGQFSIVDMCRDRCSPVCMYRQTVEVERVCHYILKNKFLLIHMFDLGHGPPVVNKVCNVPLGEPVLKCEINVSDPFAVSLDFL
jgi:hypothetical protein